MCMCFLCVFARTALKHFMNLILYNTKRKYHTLQTASQVEEVVGVEGVGASLHHHTSSVRHHLEQNKIHERMCVGENATKQRLINGTAWSEQPQ